MRRIGCFIVVFVLCMVLGFNAKAQGRILVDNSSLGYAIEQAQERNKVVAVVLRERNLLDNSRLVFPFECDSLTVSLFNNRFILLAPVGQNLRDICASYNVPIGTYGVLFIDGKGALLDKIVGSDYTLDELVAKAMGAIKASGNIYFTNFNRYEETLSKVTDGDMALIVRYSPNNSNFKGVLSGNFINPELAKALRRVAGLYAVQEESLVGETSPIYEFYKGGELKHKIAGGVMWSKIAEGVDRVETGKGLEAYRNTYLQGERGGEFLAEFVDLLKFANDTLHSTVALELLGRYSTEELILNRECWRLFESYVDRADERCFPLYVENKEELAALYGEKRVETKLDGLWVSRLMSVLEEQNGVWSVNELQLKELRKGMKRAKVSGIIEKILELRMECAKRNSDYKQFSLLLNERWEIGGLDLQQLYEWGEWIEQGSNDPDVRYRASRWFVIEADKMWNYDRIHGTDLGSLRPYFEHLAVKLYSEK